MLKKWHPEGIPAAGALIYDFTSATSIFQRHYELIARDIAVHCSEGAILDIGTGPGWLLKQLHRASPKLRLTGIDISPAMVAKARQHIHEAELAGLVDVQEGAADHLPFADASFDMVVSTGSLHHWKNPAAALNEIYRVVKDGGYALMYDLVSDTPKSLLRQATREFGKLSIFLLWIHTFEEPFYSREEFSLLAGDTPFVKGEGRFVGLMFRLFLSKAGHRRKDVLSGA